CRITEARYVIVIFGSGSFEKPDDANDRSRIHVMTKTQNKLTRRQFLYSAGLGVAAINILPGQLVRGGEGIPASEKLNVAGIGIDSRGGADVAEVASLRHNIVALCDADEKYASK